jgi:elongator complex protein 1
MQHSRRQFFLDDYLGNYSKALSDLKNLNSFEEFKGYATKHSLYQQGLELYRYQENQLNQILALYANYLKSSSKFKEAGIAYESLHEFSKAAEAYAAAHCWGEALYSASQASYSNSQFHDLALSQANGLYEMKDYYSAATIHLDYLKDVETATRIFCKGYHFVEAMRIISLRGRFELLKSIVDLGLIEVLANSTELLAECKGQLNAQVPRLRELRVKKDEDPRKSYFEKLSSYAQTYPPRI